MGVQITLQWESAQSTHSKNGGKKYHDFIGEYYETSLLQKCISKAEKLESYLPFLTL